MFELDELLADLESTRTEASPQLAVKDVLEGCVAQPRAVAEAMAPTLGGITVLLHHPDLTVLHATWAPGMRLMPHDHRMWAVIGIYQGAEDNEFHRRGPDGTLVASNGRRLETGDVVMLGESTIHSVSNPMPIVTGAIHVYGGDFVHEPRSQWGPGDLVERPYDLAAFQREFHLANVAAGLID